MSMIVIILLIIQLSKLLGNYNGIFTVVNKTNIIQLSKLLGNYNSLRT